MEPNEISWIEVAESLAKERDRLAQQRDTLAAALKYAKDELTTWAVDEEGDPLPFEIIDEALETLK